MMLLATAEEMRRADSETIEGLGLPGMVLMENAAQGAARVLDEEVANLPSLSVAALCGRGNNGGDGLAIVRILAARGVSATAYLLASEDALRGDAALNLAAARAFGVKVVPLPDQAFFAKQREAIGGHHLYIDALLGTGLSSEVKGRFAQAIELLNASEAPVLAVDIPSGLSADTGRPLGTCVRADWTATFGMMKVGLALDSGRYAGAVHLVDICIPRRVQEALGCRCALLEKADAAALLPERPPQGHKGTFGHLLVVGGSIGKSGAPLLAAQAGLRAGAGLVTAGLPASLNPVAESALLACMSTPLGETAEGGLALAAGEHVLELMQRRSALALGPGLGREEEAAELVRELAGRLNKPMVIDADGLNALAGQLGQISFASPELVITPHPGEAARLLACSVAAVLADPLAAARQLARACSGVAVLKGAPSVVAAPDGQAYVNPTGNVLLASGGSGDVLTGLVGGLLAQGSAALPAALLAVYLHGLAADLATADFGCRGLAAEELLDYLPPALCSLEQVPGGAPLAQDARAW